MDLHVCYVLLLLLESAPDIWSDHAVLLSPVLGTCSFWALLSYNLESNPDVSSQEHIRHNGLGKWICAGCVCPSQEAFLQLSRAEWTKR